jgi:ribonuclease BN (tRNA processing enzyme)
MGFPVFAPIFIPSTNLRIRGPVSFEDATLESILAMQLSYRYWPVRLDELDAAIQYDQIQETKLDMGNGLTVTTKLLNHPILCLGYRFEYQGKSIVTAYDTEPFRNIFPVDPASPGYDEEAAREGEAAASDENKRLSRFFENADILIHDCQYTAEEYASKQGWGHTSIEQAIATSRAVNVKKLVCFHHDPARTDAQLARLERHYRRIVSAAPAANAAPLEFLIAREGLALEA